MKFPFQLAVAALLSTIHAPLSTATAQSTAFTYQGRLNENNSAYTGSAEFHATLWSAASGGTALATNSPAQVVVGVTNGLFVLPLDFGANFPGANRWLQLEVRTTIGSFTTLAPRQALTPTPYAITASNLSGTLSAAQLSGPVASTNLAGTYSGAVTFNNAANAFSGSGAGLTELNASQLTSGTVPAAALGNAWKINGNAGTTPGAHSLGTTDNQPLELKVNGGRALRLEPGNFGTPNVIGGSPRNFVANGAVGATIAGGGAVSLGGLLSLTNRVLADLGTVVGGGGNTAGGYASTAMGYSTAALGDRSTAMGLQTTASGNYSTAMGRQTVTNGDSSTAMGISTAASGDSSTAMGIATTASGDYSTAMGYFAEANHRGSFVWADASGASFASTASDQFSIRAHGGVRMDSGDSFGIVLNGVDRPLITRAFDPFTSGAYAGAGRWGMFMELGHLKIGIPAVAGRFFDVVKYNTDGTSTVLTTVDQAGNFYTAGSVNPPSDRYVKRDFEPVNALAILDKVAALPIQTWSYTNDASGSRHLGPVAQDFQAAFGLGADEKHIATVDADGVALAAIQGLNTKVELRIQKLEAENLELKQRLAALERIMTKPIAKGE